jgi:uncharacterized protein (DUF1330 family)
MNTRSKIALATLAGIGIGAAAVHELHAQAKPPAYVVVAIRSEKDADALKAQVIDKASPAALAAAGGHYVVRTQTVKSLDGPSPQRFVLLAFDNMEKALAWSELPATKELTAARIKSTDSLSFIVEGVAK